MRNWAIILLAKTQFEDLTCNPASGLFTSSLRLVRDTSLTFFPKWWLRQKLHQRGCSYTLFVSELHHFLLSTFCVNPRCAAGATPLTHAATSAWQSIFFFMITHCIDCFFSMCVGGGWCAYTVPQLPESVLSYLGQARLSSACLWEDD